LIGLAVGAGVGAVNGAANNPGNGLSRGGNAVLGAVLVGGIGMVIGAATGPFFGGKAVYRSGDGPAKKSQRPPKVEPAKSAVSEVFP
jgi:hypothetical protein